jgi:hypothetical protein
MRNPDLIDALTRLAGVRGTLSAEELRQVAPVDTMSVEDVAALIAALDARGVTVEIDPALSTPRHPVSAEAGAAAVVTPRPQTLEPPASTRSPIEAAGSAGSSPAPTPARGARQPSQAAVAIAVLAAAVVVVVVVALVWAF